MSDQDLITMLQEENALLRARLLSQTLEFSHLTKMYYHHISKNKLTLWQYIKRTLCKKLKLFGDEQK